MKICYCLRGFYYYTFIFIPLLILSCQPQADGLEGFVVHPDFQMDLVAAEPLVMDPVDMEFDEKGRAFVLEMPGYPLRDAQSRLVLLEDDNGDGRFDRRILFADSLNLACSFMHINGGMLVAAPPELLFIKDTNGDNQADLRQAIMKGFSSGNLQHNYNGLSYGLDNWIYAANGGNSGRPFFVGQEDQPLDIRGDDFRFHLRQEKLERVGESSGGFELAFDHYGRMFETHNLEHLSQLVFPGYYTNGMLLEPAHALHNISDHEENGLSRIYPIGTQETRVNHPEQSGYFSGSCGTTFYGGNAFGEEYNDLVLVADVVLNLIHADKILPDGPAFKASRLIEKAEFVASEDRAFRPVNMATGPDGSLYILDMHRAVIEHPEWIPDEIEKDLDLQDGIQNGRIYRIRPRSGVQATFTPMKAGVQELIRRLESPNQWERLTAQRLLVEGKGKDAIADLKNVLQESKSPYARLHALWTLEGLDALEDGMLLLGLGDDEEGLRENALKIAEIRLNEHPSIQEPVINMLKDPHPRVQMQAALTISTLDNDRYALHQAMIFALIQQLIQANKTDIWTHQALSAALKPAATSFVQELLASEELSNAGLEILQNLTAFVAKTEDRKATLNVIRSLANTKVHAQEVAGVLRSLAQGWELNPESKTGTKWDAEIHKTLNTMESDGSISLIQASGKLRQNMDLIPSETINARLTSAKAEVLNADLAAQSRLEYLQLLGLAKFEERSEILYQLLDNRIPQDLQQAALRQLWEADHPEIGDRLLALWPTLGPEARKQAGNILLYKRKNHDLLLTAIEKGQINAGELNLDLERRRVLLWSEDPQIKTRAEALFSDAGVVQRKEAMAAMRPAIDLEGDAEKGLKLYEPLCGQCHQYGNVGLEVGPALTEIHRKSKESLLHDILDPNAAVDARYLNHQVQTHGGDIYSGIIYRETDTEIQLRMMGGLDHMILKKDIQNLKSLGISIMPEGLENGLKVQDMADLLAFLQQGVTKSL